MPRAVSDTALCCRITCLSSATGLDRLYCNIVYALVVRLWYSSEKEKRDRRKRQREGHRQPRDRQQKTDRDRHVRRPRQCLTSVTRATAWVSALALTSGVSALLTVGSVGATASRAMAVLSATRADRLPPPRPRPARGMLVLEAHTHTTMTRATQISTRYSWERGAEGDVAQKDGREPRTATLVLLHVDHSCD